MATAVYCMDEGISQCSIYHIYQAASGQWKSGGSKKVRKKCSKDELPEQAEVAEDGEPQDWDLSTCICLHGRLFSVHSRQFSRC